VRRLQRRLWMERAVWLVLLGLLAALHFRALLGERRVALVAADGRPVAVVATERDARRLLDQIKSASGLPTDKIGFAEKVTFHPVAESRNPPQSDREAMEALSEKLHLIVTAAAIIAEGQLVVGLPDQEQAVKTLSLILREFSAGEATAPPYFKENVKVDMRNVPAGKFCATAQEALTRILEESAPKAEHKVVQGDSAWKLAQRYDVSLSRLAAANPDFDMNRLQVGQTLKIPGELPPLTVIAHREVESPAGQGEGGRSQKVRITYENGVEVKREVIARRIRRQEAPQPPSAGGRSDPWRWRDEIRQ
jgi:LysM repeat protein